ncbi:MAG: hypothetical protein ABSC94_07625 [Polyangiaceae bacterium]|jgi:hypothetical protein
MPEWRLFCASAFFSGAFLGLDCAQSQHTQEKPSLAVGADTSRASAFVEAAPVAPPGRPQAEVFDPRAAMAAAPDSSALRTGDVIVAQAPPTEADPYLDSAPVAARSIGHTSYVLKVRLANGRAAAFKPRSTLPLGDRRYKSEIAAYRIARALGVRNVPLAMPRAFVGQALRRAFGSADAATDFDQKVRPDSNGEVRGALIPWIDRYEELPLEAPEWRSKWQRWLTETEVNIPAPSLPLARDLSTLLVFDYVTANWDRWSGGNVARDEATGTVLFMDNDAAFYESPPRAALARQLNLLRRVVRFSRGFVTSLRALDKSALRDSLGQDLGGEALLSDSLVDAADARRKTALAVIDDQIARTGEAATLSFE